MKSKPVLIAAAVVLFAGLTLFVRCKTSQKADAAEITRFLTKFNSSIKNGNNDSLMSCFQADKKAKAFNSLIKLLAGGIDNKIPDIEFNVDGAEIKNVNAELITVSLPGEFRHRPMEGRSSVLTLKIREVAPHQYKIVQADARKFYADYFVYEDYVKSKTLTDKDIYTTGTLAAFKTANQLKTKYDSVIWFAQVSEKTYYYVVKGKWDIDRDLNKYLTFSKDSVVDPYKMGLVGPDLKEIIPVDYDLIHNIGGTFPNLVEVEKNDKRGFFNLDGKIAVPVSYDQVFPIEDEVNLAVLRNGDDYFYLKKDLSVSEKVDIKINDFFSKIRNLSNSFNMYKNALAVVTEYNSRVNQAAIYITPSYLVDMDIAPKWQDFKNPLRKDDYADVHKDYNVGYTGTKTNDNWLAASFYSIRDYFLGGRSEFYDKKNVVIVDKKRNKIFTQDLSTAYTPDEEGDDSGGGSLEGACNVNDIKVINDSLFEVKSGTILDFTLYDSTKNIVGGPFYHYLAIKNNKLVELPESRNFNFTKYVKMDDSYLIACYNMVVGANATYDSPKSTIDHVTPEMLRYMKNEIFADYKYKFKDKRWQAVFAGILQTDKDGNEIPAKYNANVDDSLTTIDKYNINWISQKLKTLGVKSNTVAVR